MTYNDKSEMFYHQINNFNTFNNNAKNYKKILKSNRISSNQTCISIGHCSKLNFIVSILIYFIITNCVSYVHSQESNFYFNDGDAIKVSGEANDNHLETLINKNFFSIFSSEMSILNSIENQSLNGRKNLIYPENENDPNHVPIAKFHPSILDFKQQQVGLPKVQTVYITNSGKDSIKLESISGSTIHFYCSFFVDKVIPPDGNSSFDVFFLAREIGNFESSLFINTDKGIIKYTVKGNGIKNEHKLKPILNARIPLNTSFTSVLNLHNPTSEFLQVTEIYTSDDDLHLELPNSQSIEILAKDDENLDQKTKNINLLVTNKKQLWSLEPYETKPIAIIRFMGRNTNNHTAFICIKTSQNTRQKYSEINKAINKSEVETGVYGNKEKSFVLPVELEVTQHSGIFTPFEQIEFGIVSLIQKNLTFEKFVPSFVSKSTDNLYISHFYDHIDPNCLDKIFDLYLTNSGPSYLSIQNITSIRPNPSVKINFQKDIVLPPTTQQLTKVGEIRFNPTRSKKSFHNYGKIMIKTNDTSISMQINFNVDFYNGALEYDKESTKFLVSDRKNSSKVVENDEKIRQFDLLNSFQFPIVIYKVELNEIGRKFFQILDFYKPVIINNTNDSTKIESKKTFSLKFDEKQYLMYINEIKQKSTSSLHINDYFTNIPKVNLYTNFTNFEIPLNVYNKKLVLSKYNPDDEYYQEEFQEFDFNGILLNSEKKIRFQIINYNPVDIIVNLVEITKNFNSTYRDIEINLKLELIYCEPLLSKYDSSTVNDFGRKIYIQKINEKSAIKIPPHSRILMDLIVNNARKIEPKLIDSLRSNFLCTDSFNYNVKISTDFETHNLPIKFKLINGTIEITDSHSNEISTINFKTFPNHVMSFPIFLKSNFSKTLSIETIEFTRYGNIFKFEWEEQIEDDSKSSLNEPSYQNSYGLIKPNKTTLIGHLNFDSKILCKNSCYLGFEPNEDFSLKSILSASVSDLSNLSSASRSLIHNLWLKSLKIKRLNHLDSNNLLEAIDLDRKLISIMSEHYDNLIKFKNDFRSDIKILINKQDESNLTLNYTFPIEFEFEWPIFLKKSSQVIQFGSSQVNIGSSSRNFTLHNPSNYPIIVQLLLLENYASKEKFVDFMDYNSIFVTHDKSELDLNLINASHSMFTLSLNHKNSNQHHKINKILQNLDIQIDKHSIVTLLEPHENANLKIKFSPNKIGNFDNYLIIRNNLSIIEAHHLKAQAGTAEIRINNIAPAQTSYFFNNEYKHKTSDESILDIIMSEKYQACESMYRDRTEKSFSLFNFNHSLTNILEYLNILDEKDINCLSKDDVDCHIPLESDTSVNWFKNREGIVLRNLFEIKNIGTTDMYVFKILLDGEPCSSQGFVIHNCQSFSLLHDKDKVTYLDIRYQPDFTMSLIKKRLTLVTNIGDLEYLIQVKIPYDLLSYCHDSMPRPPLESYLFYLCFGLLSFLITIIFFSSIFESKSLVNFQISTIKQVKAFNEDKWFNLKEIVHEFSSAKEPSQNSKLNTQTIIRTKSLNYENESKQPKSPKAARNLKNVNGSKLNETKLKSNKKNNKEKENSGFGPFEIDTTSKNTNLSKDDSKEKKQLNRPQTPPSAEIINDLQTESNIEILTKSTKSVSEKKKYVPKITNKNFKNEDEKETVYKTISSSSSGSLSTNSSKSSTPSPSASISPVQFNEIKNKSEPFVQKEIQKEQILNSLKSKQIKNYKIDQSRLNQKLLVQNTINDTLNNIKNKDEKKLVQDAPKSEKNNFGNSNNQEIVNQNVNLLGLLELLKFQQQQQEYEIKNLSNKGLEYESQNDLLNLQLKQLYQLNQQLTQMNILMNSNTTGLNQNNSNSYPNYDPSYAYDQELANILLNSNLNDNLESFSRSVSILSKRSSSTSSSCTSSSKVFKPINENLILAESEISPSHSFDDINDILSETKFSINSTPTSDMWDLHKTNDDFDFEDAEPIDGFNPDDEYDNMVKETEKFNALLQQASVEQEFDRSNLEHPINIKKKLNKTYSNPINTQMVQNKYLTKEFAHRSNENLVAQKQFGPIERPNNYVNGSNRNIINNYQNNITNLSSLISNNLNSNVFGNFNEFRLFGDQTKRDLNNPLDNFVSTNDIWPTTSNSSLLTNPNQAWNSVLLNDFDSFSTTDPLVDQTHNLNVDSNETIKNIWSNDFNENDNNNIN